MFNILLPLSQGKGSSKSIAYPEFIQSFHHSCTKMIRNHDWYHDIPRTESRVSQDLYDIE